MVGREHSLEQTRCADTQRGSVCSVADEEIPIEAFVKDMPRRACGGLAFSWIALFFMMDLPGADILKGCPVPLAGQQGRHAVGEENGRHDIDGHDQRIRRRDTPDSVGDSISRYPLQGAVCSNLWHPFEARSGKTRSSERRPSRDVVVVSCVGCEMARAGMSCNPAGCLPKEARG